MTNFKLKEKFDVVLCLFDSINHLPKWIDWENTFKTVYNHLNPGGIFVFDIHTDNGLKQADVRTPWFRKFGANNYISINVNYDKRFHSLWDVKIFENIKGNKYQLWQEVITENAHPLSKVNATLLKYYSNIKMFDFDGKKPSENSEKIHYVCKKRR